MKISLKNNIDCPKQKLTLNAPKIWLSGALIGTSNLGVEALAEASLKCLFTHWPQADVILQTPEDGLPLRLQFNGQDFWVKRRALWLSRNIFQPQNVYILLAYTLLVNILPLPWLKRKFIAHNPYFKDIMTLDLALDITGGDSFSDIYGVRRFWKGLLLKWLFILAGKKLVMLPQTYGPFKQFGVKLAAKTLLAQTTAIYARDEAGLETVKKLLGQAAAQKTLRNRSCGCGSKAGKFCTWRTRWHGARCPNELYRYRLPSWVHLSSHSSSCAKW